MQTEFDFDVPPFDTLNTAQQAVVRATAEYVRFAAGDPLLTPEMEPSYVYLLVHGRVRRQAGVLPEAVYGAGTLLGARAVLSARATGKGMDVDTSLFDVALHNLNYPGTWYLNAGAVTGRTARSAHPSLVPSQLYRTQDGSYYLADEGSSNGSYVNAGP